jgi:hypothetical protein
MRHENDEREVIDPADIRAEIARRQWHRYLFAARIKVHPANLGRMLSGRMPIPPHVLERIRRVFAEKPSA